MPQFSNVTLFFADDAIPSKRSLNRIEQILLPEWFGEKLNRARLHGLNRHRNICMGGEKDDWNTYLAFFQFVLKVQTADTGKSHVKNQATGAVVITAWTRQELLRCSERLRKQADGLQQFLERLTHIAVIIDNEYGWHILSAHNDAPQSAEKSNRALFCRRRSSAG